MEEIIKQKKQTNKQTKKTKIIDRICYLSLVLPLLNKFFQIDMQHFSVV